MIDTTFLNSLDRLSLIINKKITSNYVGERETAYTGRGLVFKEHSIYSPGEDFRAIDWKVYARTDRLFVKKFEEERNLTVHIVLDMSSSMGFGLHKFSKADYASMLAIGFAYMAMKNNERFVLATFSDALELFKPRRGMRQLAAIVDYLNNKKPRGQSNFEASLAGYKKLINSKSFVVVISDFLYDPEQIRHAASRFRNHRVVLIQVLDRMEADLNLEGDFKLIDSESRSVLRTFISPLLRKRYIDKMQEHQAKIQEICKEIGAEFYTFSTDYPIFDAFYKALS